jgi:hypothetical protein
MINLKADEFIRLRVKLSKPEIVGSVVDGILQVIPIVGGVFSGEKISGTVVLGGADWNTTHNDGVSHVFAKYLLLTDDGEYIAIENEGFIDSKSEATIKTKPTFVANKEGK